LPGSHFLHFLVVLFGKQVLFGGEVLVKLAALCESAFAVFANERFHPLMYAKVIFQVAILFELLWAVKAAIYANISTGQRVLDL